MEYSVRGTGTVEYSNIDQSRYLCQEVGVLYNDCQDSKAVNQQHWNPVRIGTLGFWPSVVCSCKSNREKRPWVFFEISLKDKKPSIQTSIKEIRQWQNVGQRVILLKTGFKYEINLIFNTILVNHNGRVTFVKHWQCKFNLRARNISQFVGYR